MPTAFYHPPRQSWLPLIEIALAEDIGPGDLSAFLPQSDLVFEANITAKADGILSGQTVAAAVFHSVSSDNHYEAIIPDGSQVEAGVTIARIMGPAAMLLQAERTALNFLQRLSGTATLTYWFVQEVSDLDTRIVDTRKTTPGFRSLEKYAVRCGGGHNHRLGLFDAVMLKENHLTTGNNIAELVALARQNIPHTSSVVVEAETLDQARQAAAAKADVVLLDNMTCEELTQAVAALKGKIILEASGGVTLQTVRDIALTGVDVISVGALTHSAPALDLSMRIKGPESF